MSNIINLNRGANSPLLYQEVNNDTYNEYLKYNQKDKLKEFDYFYNVDTSTIYYIYDIYDNIYKVIDLSTNKSRIFKYPFQYLKIDGNDPNEIKNVYGNMCQKNNKKLIN